MAAKLRTTVAEVRTWQNVEKGCLGYALLPGKCGGCFHNL